MLKRKRELSYHNLIPYFLLSVSPVCESVWCLQACRAPIILTGDHSAIFLNKSTQLSQTLVIRHRCTPNLFSKAVVLVCGSLPIVVCSSPCKVYIGKWEQHQQWISCADNKSVQSWVNWIELLFCTAFPLFRDFPLYDYHQIGSLLSLGAGEVWWMLFNHKSNLVW